MSGAIFKISNPTGDDRLTKATANTITSSLFALIPVSWQHYFRDSGGTQALLDIGATFLAAWRVPYTLAQ